MVEFSTNPETLENLVESFEIYMWGLRLCHVPEKFALPTMCKVLGLRFDLESTNHRKRERERRRFAAFRERAYSLVSGYFGDLGSNAYALLAVMSDFASHPFVCRTQSVSANVLQARVGHWVETFVTEAMKTDFDFGDYVQGHLTMFGLRAA